jgi:type II secretory pathway pseudopilin PulG
LITIALVAMLVALWVPMVSRVRERSRRQACTNNLRNIANALQFYRQTNSGNDPRTTYAPGLPPDVSATGAAATDPFGPGGPPPNNVPAALFLLVRAQSMSPSNLICPSAAADRFAPDDYAGLDPFFRSNFSDVRRNLAYSFFYTYTDTPGAARTAGPIAADLNPGPSAAVGPAAASEIAANPAAYRRANSTNHAKAGQFVLYPDYSVEWFTTPFAGLLTNSQPDNIYTTRRNKTLDPPVDGDDSLLLPAEE